MERLKYIKDFYDDIANVLSRETIVQFDEVITQPNDVELGTLHFLIKSFKINVPSWADRERVSFLRDCRNKIAHMNCCTVDEVK